MRKISDECLKELGTVLLKHGYQEIASSMLRYGSHGEHEAELIVLGDFDAGPSTIEVSVWHVQNVLEALGIKRERYPESLEPFRIPHR